ncbi:MAG TPA: DUF4407 domain-containing protein [Chitinophagaceae bacterium]|nr:DUF4407 domain-containing protein [Chitinophagaceae bacterium]
MITEFLLFCSGSDKEIIAKCPKSERNKYASIGATVFLTGLLAAISSGYALYTIFRGEEYALLAAIIFGLIWATVIFNLDRYIVSSLRKEGNWKKELLHASPRFIIAILISLVIAKPLEVRIFASRIEQQILEDKRNKLAEEKLNIDKLNDLTKLENTVQEQNVQLKQLDSLRLTDPPTDEFKSLVQNRNQASNDLARTSQINNTKIANYNSRITSINNNTDNYYKDEFGVRTTLRPEFKKEKNDLAYSRNVLINEIKSKQKKIEDIDTDIKKARDDYKATIAQKINNQNADIEKTKLSKGEADSIANIQMNESYQVKERSYTNNFITQVEALGHLNSEPYTTMWWTNILLMFLFITIETAPIVVKLLTKRGPYDELLDRIEYEHYLEQQKIISDKNNEVNTLLTEIQEMNKLKGEVRIKTEKSKLDAELKANETLLNEIAKKQADLANIAIDKWYNDELSKLKGNPTYQYAQTKQAATLTIEDKLWKATNVRDEVFYLFKNGQPINNELIYIENGKNHKGSWEYLTNHTQIKINILSNAEVYTIESVTKDSARLKSATNFYLELTKV